MQTKEDGVLTFGSPSIGGLATQDLGLDEKPYSDGLWLYPLVKVSTIEVGRLEDEVVEFHSLADLRLFIRLLKCIFGNISKTDHGGRKFTIDW